MFWFNFREGEAFWVPLFRKFLCAIVLRRLTSPLSKDETRRDSSFTLTISH